jgi:hypothetical protein
VYACMPIGQSEVVAMMYASTHPIHMYPCVLQYNAIHLSHPSTKDCDIYGAHHLLRVLVMMPQLLSATNLNAVESSVFKQHILALMTWMERNRSDLFADVEFIETDKAYRDASV